MPRLAASGVRADRRFDPGVRDALLDAVMHSASDLAIVPLQDVFGWRDRINVPATVGPDNWSWVSPIPVDRLLDDAEGRARADDLARLIRESGR